MLDYKELAKVFGQPEQVAARTSAGIPVDGASIPDLIRRIAHEEGVGQYADLLVGLAKTESALKPDAQNSETSAGGLFQFIDSTARRYGITDKYDPEQNSRAAARMFRDHLQAFGGDVNAALAAHHVGAGKARAALQDSGIGDVNISTQDWLRRVLANSGAVGQFDAPGRPRPQYTADLSGALSDGRDQFNALAERAALAEGHRAADIGRALQSGVGHLISDVGWGIKKVTGYGQLIDDWGKSISENAEANMTPAMRASREKMFFEEYVDENGEVRTRAGDAWSDPWAWASAATDMGASIVPMAIASGGAGAAARVLTMSASKAQIAATVARAQASAKAQGLTGKAATQYVASHAGLETAKIIAQAERAAGRAGMVAGAFSEGVLQGTSYGRQAGETVRQMGFDELAEHSEMFRDLVAGGASEEDAREQVALVTENDASLRAGGVGAVTGSFMGYVFGRMGASVTGNTPQNVLGATTRTGRAAQAGLGATTVNAAQEGASQYAANTAIRDTADETYRPMTNVADVSARGAIGGGPAGVVVGALSGNPESQDDKPDNGMPPPPPVAPPPNSPLTAAAMAADQAGALVPVAEPVIDPDSFDGRLERVRSFVEDNELIRAIRGTQEFGAESVNELLSAWAKARNPNVDMLLREQALAGLEQFLDVFMSRPNFTFGQQQADQGDQFRDATKMIEGPAFAERDITPDPAQALETENAMRARAEAQAAYEQAFEDLRKAEELGAADAELMAYQQAMQEAQAVRESMDARLAEIQATIEGNQRMQVEQARMGALDQILADPETVNPLKRFEAELERMGLDAVPTSRERQVIARFEDLRNARREEPQAAPEGFASQDVALTAASIAQRTDPRSQDPRTDRIAVQEQYLQDLVRTNPAAAERAAIEMRQNAQALSEMAGVSPEMIGRYASVIERRLAAMTPQERAAADPSVIPSAPNELRPYTETRQEQAPAQTRDKIAEVRDLIAQGWRLNNRALVGPRGQRRNLNAVEYAAAKEALRRADEQVNPAGESIASPTPAPTGVSSESQAPTASDQSRPAPSQRSESAQQDDQSQFISTRTDEQLRYLTTNGKPDVQEAAIAELAKREAQTPTIASAVDAAAHEAATSPLNDKPEPTEAQKEAGNYAKGTVRLHGMDIVIENPRGSVRSGVGPDGVPWQNVMAHHYGYIKGSRGADGDQIDVFLTDGAEDATVAWVIDQKHSDGTFDEHKVVIGEGTEEAARAAYLANYDAGWDGIGAISSMPMEVFRAWALDGKRKKAPLAYVEPTPAPAQDQAAEPISKRADWQADFPDAVIMHRAEVIHSHPDYRAAKDGDEAAALRLVEDTVTDEQIDSVRDMLSGRGEVVVAVHAEEASGRNKIPVALASYLAERLGLRLDDSIVQARKVNRGGADGFHRLATPVPFAGVVEAGVEYLIVDDTLAQGGTLASLKGYIETNGGEVVGATALMGKQYSSKLSLSPETLQALRAKYGQELEGWWNDEFGYGFDKLTESEARYLASIRGADADAIRDRILAARQGRNDSLDAGSNADGGAPGASQQQVTASGQPQPLTSEPFAQIEEGKSALIIQGDPAAIKERLDAAGIKSVPRKTGVSVPNKSQWSQARGLIPVRIDTYRVEGVPDRLADVTIEVMESGQVTLKSQPEIGQYPDVATALKRYAESYRDSPETAQPSAPALTTQDEYIAANPDLAERRARTRWAMEVAEAIESGQEVAPEIVAELLAKEPQFAPDVIAPREVLMERYDKEIDRSIANQLKKLEDEHAALAKTLDHKRVRTDTAKYDEVRGQLIGLNERINQLKDEQRERARGNKVGGSGAEAYLAKRLVAAGVDEAAAVERVFRQPDPLDDADVATHQDPGQPMEPVTQATVAEAARESVRNTDFNAAEAKKWLLAEIDQAIANVPQRNAELQAELARAKAAKFVPSERVQKLPKSPMRGKLERKEREAFEARTDDAIAKSAQQIGFVTFDVPGDGKFKVVNTVEKLNEFRKKVNSSPGFSNNPTRPMGTGSGLAGAVPLDQAIADAKKFGGDVLAEIGNAIEVARLKGKGEDLLLERFKEESNGKEYDAWRAEQEAAEEIAAREAEQQESAGDPQGFADMMAMYEGQQAVKTTIEAVRGAYGDASAFLRGKTYSNAVDTQHKGRLEARLVDAGLTKREAQDVIASALTLRAGETRGQGPMAFLQMKYVLRAAADRGLIPPVNQDGRAVLAEQYAGPADVSSREGQMELADRAGTIAALKAMNEQLRQVAPNEAWADSNIEQAADLDALRTQISEALVRANRAEPAEQDSPLRKRLEEASGADLKAVFDALGLAGARMTHDERVRALMAEDARAVSDALDDVLADGKQLSADAVAAERFIPAPDGSIDYGEITPEMAQQMRRQAGKIRLQRGDDKFGERHIELRHGKDIRGVGYGSVSGFVADALRNINAIWKPSKTSQLVVVEAEEHGKVVFIELKPSETGDFYTVNSAFPTPPNYADKKEARDGWIKVWDRMALRSSAPAAQSPSAGQPPAQAGGDAATPSGQTSEPTVSPSATSGNAPTLTGNRRNPTQVSAFNPYEAGDVVTIAGKDWQVQQGMGGWYLTDTGNWRGTHPTIQRIKAMNELISEVEQAATESAGESMPDAAAAETEAEASDLLTPEQARALMTWEDRGQRDNVRRMNVLFFENAEDQKAGRGGMVYGTIESYQRGKWNIDGTTYPTLKAAKAAAVERAIERLREDGYVASATQAATQQAATAVTVEEVQSQGATQDDTASSAEQVEAGERALDDQLRAGNISIEQYATANGLPSFDDDFLLYNRISREAQKAAKAEHPYHKGIANLIAAVQAAESALKKPSAGAGADVAQYKIAVSKYRSARDFLEGVISKNYEHPFRNNYVTKLPPMLEARYGKQWNDIETGDAAKRSYRDLLSQQEAEAWIRLARTTQDDTTSKAEQVEDAAPQEASVDDVGANLFANRRNFTDKALAWDDIKDLNEALRVKQAVKSKVWPKPDYEQLVKDGMPVRMARFVKHVYDAIGAKPNGTTDAQLQSYMAVVGRIREAMQAWTQDPTNIQAAKDGAKVAQDTVLRLVWPEEMARPSAYDRFRRGTEANAEANAIGGNRAFKKLQIGYSETRAWDKDIAAGWPAKQEMWQKRGYRVMAPGEYVIESRKLHRYSPEARERLPTGETAHYVRHRDSSRMWRVPENFNSEQYVLAQDGGSFVEQFPSEDAAIEAARERVKSRRANEGADLRGMNVAETVRQGPARRSEGENISSQQFMETFGFRGVNFGRRGYINEVERQEYLNQAFDALMDLAEVLNIPPKALSLNGMLGIAFGAQGSGGFAAAHFVPGVNEINLTKNSGAGTLAHEWGHALDHYFATQAGLAAKERPFLSEHFLNEAPEGIRQEIVDLFKVIRDRMLSRPATEDEVAQSRQRSIDVARQRLKGWIDALERDYGGKFSDGQKAEFDRVRELLMQGELGEKAEGARIHANVSSLLSLVTEARGRRPKRDFFSGIEMNAQHLRYALHAQEADKTHVPQQANTEYLRQSQLKDAKKKGRDYWATRAEMFARAFELFVHDRLVDAGNVNTFLSDAGLRVEMTTVEQGPGGKESTVYSFPYPRNAERESINAAFADLVEGMKTRETDQGIALFRSASDANAGTVDGVVSIADANATVEGFVDTFPGSPDFEVVSSFDDLPATVQQDARNQGSDEKTTKGIFKHGKVYLVAGNHASIADFEATVFHEALGHFGIRALMGDEFVQQMNQLYVGLGGQGGLVKIMNARGMGDVMQEYIRGILQAQQMDADAFRAAVKAGDPQAKRIWTDAMVRAVMTEEVFAHIAEQQSRPGLMDRIKALIGKVRQWLRDHNLMELAELGETDMLHMLDLARRKMGEPSGDGGPRGGMPAVLSRRAETADSAQQFRDTERANAGTINFDGIERPTTNSNGKPIHPTEEGIRNFWRWFGDSKVVDDQGRPLVMYHGTGNLEGLAAFDPGLTGKGNDQIGSGFYFTTDRTEASGYTSAVTQNAGAGARKLGGDTSPGVAPVYLKIERPIVVEGSNLTDTEIDLTPTQSFEIIKRAPNILDLDESPMGDWIDVWSKGKITDQMLRDVAKNYAGASLISLENDFFRGDAEAFRQALFDIINRDGVTQTFGDKAHWVAWFPTQIKSAIGNQGTFDGANPNIMRRRTEAATEGGLSAEGFRSALVERFGEDGVTALEAQGLLNIVGPEEGSPGNPAWYEDGKAFFVPEYHASAQDAVASVLHEVGEHFGLEGMLGERGWRTLKARVARLAAEGSAEIRAAWDGVLDNYPEFAGAAESSLIGNDRFMHEVVAKLGERAAGRKSSIWRDMLAAVNRFLLKMGIGRQINKNEIADLVEGSLKRVMRGQGTDGGPGGRMDARNRSAMSAAAIHGPTSDAEKARVGAFLNGNPIKVISERLSPEGGYAKLREWASKLFRSAPYGGKARNQILGEVLLDDRAVRDTIAHGMSRAKAEAFAAVPDVVAKGEIVHVETDGKLDSIYISAPVRILGVDDIVTVMIHRDPNTQRMYLHSVATKENLLAARLSSADAEASERSGPSQQGGIKSVLQELLNFNPEEQSSGRMNRISFDPRDYMPGANKPAPAGLSSPAIESRWKRFLSLRGFFESAADLLKRTPGLEDLGQAVVKYYDQTRANRAAVAEPEYRAREIKKRLSSAEWKRLNTDFEAYRRAVENGRQAEAAQVLADGHPDLAELNGIWQEMAEITGDMARDAGVMVQDATTGEFRPMGKVKNFWPRTMTVEVQNAIDAPHKHPEKWNELIDAIVADGRATTPEEAAEYLRKYRAETDSNVSDNDYFAGIEKGRAEPLPEAFYDYSWDAGLRYKEAWADRLAQIQAFGQSYGQGPNAAKDLFEQALERIDDAKTRDYVKRVRAHAYNEKYNDPLIQAGQFFNAAATALQLGNPATALLNLVSGTGFSFQEYGIRRSLGSLIETARDFKKHNKDAFLSGILTDDYLQVLHDSERTGVPAWLRWTVAKSMQVGGYTPAEHFIRTFNMVVGRNFLRDALKSFNTDPGSKQSAKYAAWMQEHGFNPDDLVREDGKGPETDRFVRYTVNLTQGSYRIDQTPLFVDSHLGRILFKYQKFGTQLTRWFWKSALKPFVQSLTGGQKVDYEINGVKYSNRLRNFVPLLRFFGVAAASGMLVMDWREELFGYQNKAPTWGEIDRALQDDEKARAVAFMIDRAWHQMLAAGALGFFGNYVQMANDVADRQRVRSPLDPPAIAPIKSVGNLILDVVDQGVSLTPRNVDNFFNESLSLYRTGKRLGAKAYDAADVDLFGGWKELNVQAAKSDVAFVKKMTRRYAAEEGLQAKRRAPDRYAATVNTPFNNRVIDAILVGDAARARLMVRDYMNDRERFPTAEDRSRAMMSLKASIRARDPSRVGVAPSEAERQAFLRWAKANTTAQEFARIERITNEYRRTAQRAGLL